MNNRILIGSLLLAASATTWSGCAKTQSRNDALFGGSNSALTTANAGPGGEVGKAAMGSVPQPKTPTTTDRLLSPLRSVKKTFTPQPVKSDSPPDPISLANAPTKPTPDLFLSAARVIATSGNNQSAQSLYEQALVADPGNRDAMLELARIYVQQNQREKARDVYLKAVEFHPQDPIVFNDLGLFHLQVEDPEMSIKALQRAVQLDPQRTLYRNNLANAYVVSGRIDLALDQLLAVQAKPVAHYNLGYLLYSHRNYLPAIEQFDLAFQEDDQFYDAYVMKTRLIEELEKEKQNSPQSFVRPVSYEETEDDRSTAEKTNHSAAQGSSSATQSRQTTSRKNPQMGRKPIIERTPEEALPAATSHSKQSPLEVAPTESPIDAPDEPRIFKLSDQDASEMLPLSERSQQPDNTIHQVGFDAEVAMGGESRSAESEVRLADYESPVDVHRDEAVAQLALLNEDAPNPMQKHNAFRWAARIWNLPTVAAVSSSAPDSQQVDGFTYPVTDAPRLLDTTQVDGQIDNAAHATTAAASSSLSSPTSDAHDFAQDLDSRMLISPSQYLEFLGSNR